MNTEQLIKYQIALELKKQKPSISKNEIDAIIEHILKNTVQKLVKKFSN